MRHWLSAIRLAQDTMIPFRLTLLATLFVYGTAFAQRRSPFKLSPRNPCCVAMLQVRDSMEGRRQSAFGGQPLSGGGLESGPWLRAPM